MNHGLKRFVERLCGAGALALPLSVLPMVSMAQQPVVEDLSGSGSGFYEQAQTQSGSNGSLVLFNQVQEHGQEIQRLRGEIEELRHQMEQLRRQSQQRYLDIEDRLMSIGPSQVEESTPEVEPEAAEEVANTPSPSGVSEEARQAYQDAFAHVQERRFGEAIAAFKAFVEQHPDTSLTANGHYWLGELYAAEGELEAAEQSFNRVIDNYADSSKVPDAMYKLGLVKARQGEAEASRALLEKVQDDYPQSSAAGLADDFLRQGG
ncbi:tol-pal system protein YbgF [Halomonas sp. CUBES01]|uniref:Cell division coordinator CpoB n=1 Tax=Vreelandella gomseomensis TaxID=370766 RepID=A0ABU1GBN7_9GAMM|nr:MULTISPECIES: tol-pal system protein YbgF [Halomonas]MDR5874878.1 tol-pal system protein YbgF [Halomonas gomseomensis]MEC4767316.1 tol-pal system protein YbgF [Halomonas sp. CUBES01]